MDPVSHRHNHSHSRPRSARLHLFHDGTGHFVLDAASGRIHPLAEAHATNLDQMLRLGDPARAGHMLMALGLGAPPREFVATPERVIVRALSLAVAQKCNLSCTYCYAQQGSFGGKAVSMSVDTAKASVDRLLEGVKAGEKITLGFMGGEPLLNRETVHAATRHTAQEAAARGAGVSFAMTSNATLLQQEDIDLFHQYHFTITVSIDGLEATHDRLRPFVSGKGSFSHVHQNVERLLNTPGRTFKVLGRVTVTPKNLHLPEIMAGLLEMGFDGIMFTPMLSAPSGKEEMQNGDFDEFLNQLIQCGDRFLQALREGRVLPLTNVIEHLQRIHGRRQDDYPCGAGGGYMAVSAEGSLFACHRFVDDDRGRMGSVQNGVDASLQTQWLHDRHLAQQSPCPDCWARHLCAGSCHYEVIKRGRPACDYIRGWLHYCLTLYTQLARYHPESLQQILLIR